MQRRSQKSAREHGSEGRTGEVSYTVGGATAPPPPQLSGLLHQLCALSQSHHLLSDLIVFWLKNEHYPPRARKAFEFEDSFILKFLFARFVKDNHQLTSHFAPPSFSEKLHPCIPTTPCQVPLPVTLRRRSKVAHFFAHQRSCQWKQH